MQQLIDDLLRDVSDCSPGVSQLSLDFAVMEVIECHVTELWGERYRCVGIEATLDKLEIQWYLRRASLGCSWVQEGKAGLM